jgi:hypothetical protein
MIMGGFHFFEGSDKAGDLYAAIHPLTYKDVLSMLRIKILSLPTEEEIQDKSKSDWLAKTIVLLQTLWFVMQCIARSIENLPTTELEIVTLAYTAINVGMLIAWWDKPRNIDRPIRVFRKPVKNDSAKSAVWWEKVLKIITGVQDEWVDLRMRTKVPIFYSGNPDDKEIFTADGITLTVGVVFGAIHCIAWFFDFRSQAERLLWRLSSVAITTVPALLGLSLVSLQVAKRYGDSGPDFVQYLLIFCPFLFSGATLLLMPLLGLLYVAARFATLVLAFMNLASLPPGAFQAVHWTTLKCSMLTRISSIHIVDLCPFSTHVTRWISVRLGFDSRYELHPQALKFVWALEVLWAYMPRVCLIASR